MGNKPQPDFKPGDEVYVKAVVRNVSANGSNVLVEITQTSPPHALKFSMPVRVEFLHPSAVAAAPPDLPYFAPLEGGERAIHAFCLEHEEALSAHPVGAAVEVTDEMRSAGLKAARSICDWQSSHSALSELVNAVLKAALSAKASPATHDEPVCPGPNCIMCSGEACNYCGKGCWNNAASFCGHDVIERHAPTPAATLASEGDVNG